VPEIVAPGEQRLRSVNGELGVFVEEFLNCQSSVVGTPLALAFGSVAKAGQNR